MARESPSDEVVTLSKDPNMKSIFETCTPRDEALHGSLREQQFAVSLTRVLRSYADDVYGDPATYFANTYPESRLSFAPFPESG